MVTAGSAAASSRNFAMQIEQWQSPGVDAIQCAVSIVNIERVRYLKYNSMSKKMVACTLKQISMATHSHTNHAYTLAHTHTQRTRTHTHARALVHMRPGQQLQGKVQKVCHSNLTSFKVYGSA